MPYNSLNEETGMLDDINEVRDVAHRLVLFIKMIADMGLLDFALSKPALYDIAASVAEMEALTSPTSQANFIRTMGYIMGRNPVWVEAVVQEWKLSEVYPVTHPQATHIDTTKLPIDPNDPFVQRSKVLSQLADELKEQQPETPPTKEAEDVPPVQLPESMETFLRKVLGGNADAGDRGSSAS